MEIDVIDPYVLGVTIPAVPSPLSVNVSSSTATVVIVPTPGPPGIQGIAGPAGNNAPVYAETPSGVSNGSNTIFTLSNSFQPRSTQVYRNGLREQLGIGYTESTPEIIFTTPPITTDVISVDYLIA